MMHFARHLIFGAPLVLSSCVYRDFEVSPSVGAAVCGEQAFTNPNLDQVEDEEAVGWKTMTVADYHVITEGDWADSGDYVAYLGGYEGAADMLWQNFELPKDFAGATLSFQRWFEPYGGARTEPADYLYVEVINDQGKISRLATFSNLDISSAWVTTELEVTAEDLRGRLKGSIRFLATTLYLDDGEERFSSFYLDTITFTLHDCTSASET